MIIAKWGNSLAVRLPAGLIQTLNLKEGDAVDLQPVAPKQFSVKRSEPNPSFAASFIELREILASLDEEEALPSLPRSNRQNDFADMLDG